VRMAFRGWTTEALDFYEGLEADNSKTYWTEHKAVYDEKVYAPMVELLAELEDEFGAGRVFRPYRDVRFSSDKSPYKTTIAATVGGDSYIQLSAHGLGAGRGTWMMAPDQLVRYRDAVAADATGATLARAIATLRSKKIDVGAHGELKTVPRGYPKDHPRADLLRAKGLTVWQEWEAGPWLGRPTAKTRVVELLRAAAPVSEWLESYVGESHEEPP
jgi:uncharacterized protein (TIGR02453 family)